MKKVYYTITIILLTFNAISQNINIGIKIGYGFFQLNDIKNFQKSIKKNNISQNIKSVETFPGNFIYSFSLDYKMKNNNTLGLEFSTTNTGGRNHVKDYSGEYKLDMLLNNYRLGIAYKANYKLTDRIKLLPQIKIGGVFSTLDIKENITVFDSTLVSENYNFLALGIFIKPSISFSYNFFKDISVIINSGYELDLGGKTHLKGDNKAYLISNNNIVYTNWSGYRISVGISYYLRKQ